MQTAAPISLYLDLAEGETASIEVVARAALAWSAAIKELAYIVDPAIEVEIDLVSGTEGSLDLNACIKAISKVAGQQPKLATIVVTALTWFTVQTGAYTYEKLLDWLTGTDAPPAVSQMTKAQIEEIAQEVVKAQQRNLAGKERQQLFRELDQDTSIVAVGSSQKPSHRPSALVPRSAFAERAGASVLTNDVDVKRRTETERLVVVLISPTLKDAERRWRFQVGSLPEFGATMKDHGFLEALAAGRVSLPLRAGIDMEIELETKQELVGQVWVVRERNVTRVIRPGLLDDRTKLPLLPGKPNR